MATIQTDILTRRLYANDASMYEELPSGVAFPETVDDIVELVHRASAEGLALTPRSAGTSLAGQATGGGIVMDVSRYMTGIVEIDPDRREAVGQPGVIRDTLNREAAVWSLQFRAHTSTTNRFMIGGMIGNNSSGSFSIKHKTTREHVLEVEAVLSDGSVVTFGPISDEELEEKCRLETLEGEISRVMAELLKENRTEIPRAFQPPY